MDASQSSTISLATTQTIAHRLVAGDEEAAPRVILTSPWARPRLLDYGRSGEDRQVSDVARGSGSLSDVPVYLPRCVLKNCAISSNASFVSGAFGSNRY